MMNSVRHPKRRAIHWLLDTHCQGYERWWPGLRLGSVPEERVSRLVGEGMSHDQALQIAGIRRRQVDACIVLPQRLLLVRIKQRPGREGAAALSEYVPLVAETPELADYRGRPVSMVLLYFAANEEELGEAWQQGASAYLVPEEGRRAQLWGANIPSASWQGKKPPTRPRSAGCP